MKCIILSAGYATRLYPLTENFPKPLLKVRDKAIIDWLVDDIEGSKKVDKYYLVSNGKYFSHFKKWAEEKKENIEVINDKTITNESRLGAVNDIMLAIECQSIDDDTLIIAGDNVLDFSLNELIEYFDEKKATSIMRYCEKDQQKLKKCGVLCIDENDYVVDMVEKSPSPPSNWCCPPFYLIKREDLKLVKRAIDEKINTDAPGSFIAWLTKNTNVYAYEMHGKRYDIGDIESYNNVQKEYKGITKR